MARLTSKDNPYSRKSPDQEWDYIIVGSGMGGMTSAALLSQLGRKVLVLEQHYVPGGFTHVFRRKGYSWDVGVHAVGEVSERAITGRLLSSLTGGRLEWTSLGDTYEEFHYPEDFRIDFPDNRDGFVENLIQAFPEEEKAIQAYIGEVKEQGRQMRRWFLSKLYDPRLAGLAEPLVAGDSRKAVQERTSEVLGRITGNAKLRAVLAGQWGYYGSVPSRSSWLIHALVVKHFWYGAYYPVGGSERIAMELLRTVADNGGWTRVTADVQELILEWGRVRGVRLASGEEIRAKRVISAIGGIPTVQRLLPEKQRKKTWAQSIDRLDPSPAHLCLNLGFKGDIRKAGASAANKWFCGTWRQDDSAWRDLDTPPPILYTSFPSLKDPEHDPGPEERHTGEVVTFLPREAFSEWDGTQWKRRGESYDRLKEELSQRMLDRLFEHMPDLKPMLDYHELSTPLSTEHFCRSASGAIYGIEPTPRRFANPWLRPRTPLPGLFMSGSDVGTVGVMGAFVGGVLTALSAEPVRAVNHLRKL